MEMHKGDDDKSFTQCRDCTRHFKYRILSLAQHRSVDTTVYHGASALGGGNIWVAKGDRTENLQFKMLYGVDRLLCSKQNRFTRDLGEFGIGGQPHRRTPHTSVRGHNGKALVTRSCPTREVSSLHSLVDCCEPTVNVLSAG